MNLLCSFFLSIALLFTASCASFSSDSSENEVNPNIHPGAYGGDGFVIDVAPPIHPEWNPLKFYFKQCEELGIGDHFTRMDYSCTYP